MVSNRTSSVGGGCPLCRRGLEPTCSITHACVFDQRNAAELQGFQLSATYCYCRVRGVGYVSRAGERCYPGGGGYGDACWFEVKG